MIYEQPFNLQEQGSYEGYPKTTALYHLQHLD